MPKIVINKCYGGFGISVEALIELVKRKAICVTIQTPEQYYGVQRTDVWNKDFSTYNKLSDEFYGHRNAFNVFKGGLLYSIDDRDSTVLRTDKDLVEVVETMGEKANGQFAELKVVEIPDGVDWAIAEYDGTEHIYEIHRTWS